MNEEDEHESHHDEEKKESQLKRRLRAFIVSNGTSVLSVVPALLLLRLESSSQHRGESRLVVLKWFLVSVFRLAFVSSALDYLTAKRRLRKDEAKGSFDVKEPTNTEMVARMTFVAAPFEVVSSLVALQCFTTNSNSWCKFLPKTFVFELLMDFGHYLSHRAFHSNQLLYRLSGHKVHHMVHKPTAFATFHQSPIDVALTNVIPVLAALWFMDRFLKARFTKEQFLLLMGLKTYVEVAGHVGVLDSKASSFPQFVWLPRMLGIELSTRDHDAHHTQGGKYNFSKRFTLFDKVFGTYKRLDQENKSSII